MTTNQIQKKAEREMIKYEVAKQIRELLDAARKSYGPTDWDDENKEDEVIELVTGE